MRLRKHCLLIIFLTLLLGGCGEDGIFSAKLVLGGDLLIPSGQVERSDIFLADGSVTIEPGGQVDGDIYQFLGLLVVGGVVDGNISQYNGELRLGSAARINGDLLLGGGVFSGDSGTSVQGQVLHSEIAAPSPRDWIEAFSRRRLGWAVGESLLLACLGALGSWIFPRPLSRLGDAIWRNTLTSAAMGLLVGLVGVSLLVQMAFTILLIPVSMLGLLAGAAAVIFGWLGFGSLLGAGLSRRLRIKLHPSLSAGLGTGLFMLLVNFASVLPYLGGLLALTSVLIGLGAVFLTRFGLRRFVHARDRESGSWLYN